MRADSSWKVLVPGSLESARLSYRPAGLFITISSLVIAATSYPSLASPFIATLK
jgi:hypothetical protein